MKVSVWITERGHVANSLSKVFDLPLCPGPGWWIDLPEIEDSFRVDNAGVADTPWVQVKVDDIERYREAFEG